MPGDIAISGVRILLIDDDPEFCSLLNDYLELNSISLTCAHDGQSGLDILDRRAFDLILLDMFLPDINGLDVLRRIRRMQSPPVVMLSAHNEETDRIIALEIGADDYVPKAFSPRELREIDPAHNAGIHVVPQLMGHCAEDFLWMAGRLADMGYDEVNFNLGCPSNTVTAKKKGAGLLTEPDLLRRFFDAVFAACPLPVSVKTRLGKTTAETFPALLELYNDYPICELIVHPRVQADQYHGHPDLDMFAYALAHSRAPVCYNGDLFDAPAVHAFQARFPAVERIMLGRGLAANPGLIGQLRTGKAPTAAQLQLFHDRLYAATRARIPDRRALLFRMKEAWRYLGCSFADAERPLRRIRKAQDMIEYESAVRQLFASCPVRENAGYFV